MKVRLVLWTLLLASPAILAGCHVTPGGNHNLPPAERLMHPGPGVGGPGPGVMMQQGGGVSQGILFWALLARLGAARAALVTVRPSPAGQLRSCLANHNRCKFSGTSAVLAALILMFW